MRAPERTLQCSLFPSVTEGSWGWLTGSAVMCCILMDQGGEARNKHRGSRSGARHPSGKSQLCHLLAV